MFISVTQAFNTGTSMGRLMLNVLLSFAQFEREMISKRTSRQDGRSETQGTLARRHARAGRTISTALAWWSTTAKRHRVRQIFELYQELGRDASGRARTRASRVGATNRGRLVMESSSAANRFTKTSLHRLLTNITYVGKARYKQEIHAGKHEAIIDAETCGPHPGLACSERPHWRVPSTEQVRALLKGHSAMRRLRLCHVANAFDQKSQETISILPLSERTAVWARQLSISVCLCP